MKCLFGCCGSFTGNRYTIHILLLVPSMIHQLVNHELTGKTDLSSVVHVHSGAAYLPPALAEKMKGFVKDVPQVFEGVFSVLFPKLGRISLTDTSFDRVWNV